MRMRLPFGWTLSRPSRIAQATTAHSADTPENDAYWRAGGSLRDGTRDLPAAERAHALQTVGRLIERDGLASRMTQQIREWCVGDGASLVSGLKDDAKREAHEAALAELWAEPQTGWPELQGEVAENLAPVGEMLFTLNPPPTGRGPTAYGVVAPERIEGVLLNPNNARQTVGVLLKKPDGVGKPEFFFSAEFREWAKANAKGAAAAGFGTLPGMGEDVHLPGAWFGGKTVARVGPDCAYFPWRRRLGASRGLSMFFPVADLISALDAAIFQQVEGVAARNAWCAWVKAPANTKPGEAQDMAKNLANQIGKGGGHFGTAGEVEVQILAPELGAIQFDAHLQTMLKIVSAETGWPITWLGLGGDTGNSATTELAGPALKMMRLHQASIQSLIWSLIAYGMKRMPRPSGMTEKDWLDFEVQLPEIGGRDMVRDTSALAQGTVATDAAEEAGAFTTAKGGEIRRMLFTKFLGVEFDGDDIPEEVPETGPGDTSSPAQEKAEGDEDPTDDEARRDADDLARAREQGAKARQGRKRARV